MWLNGYGGRPLSSTPTSITTIIEEYPSETDDSGRRYSLRSSIYSVPLRPPSLDLISPIEFPVNFKFDCHSIGVSGRIGHMLGVPKGSCPKLSKDNFYKRSSLYFKTLIWLSALPTDPIAAAGQQLHPPDAAELTSLCR